MDRDFQFIEEVAALLMIWGIPLTPARLYGHLLLQPGPVSLDDITAKLEIGKTTAVEAARLMERYGFLRRYGERGTKRISYAPSDDFTHFFLTQSSYLTKMSEAMKSRATAALPVQPRKRLAAMARYYGRLGQLIKEVSEDFG